MWATYQSIEAWLMEVAKKNYEVTRTREMLFSPFQSDLVDFQVEWPNWALLWQLFENDGRGLGGDCEMNLNLN
jgi:hypothetical protein